MKACLKGQQVHDPAEKQSDADERTKDLGAVDGAFAGRILAKDTEDHRHQKGEKNHSGEVRKGHRSSVSLAHWLIDSLNH